MFDFDTIIVGGGNIQKDFALDFLKKCVEAQGREKLRLIAADRGLDFFREAGVDPDCAVGDFDSLSLEGREYLEKENRFPILRLKPEKDDSDTQSAVKYAIGQGAGKIMLLGATGTRLDHVLANLELLVMGRQQGVEIRIADANNYIALARSGMVIKAERLWGKYISFFPLGGDVEGLTLQGFKYPLKEYRLRTCDCGLTVSNELADPAGQVWFRGGTLLMLMTKD